MPALLVILLLATQSLWWLNRKQHLPSSSAIPKGILPAAGSKTDESFSSSNASSGRTRVRGRPMRERHYIISAAAENPNSVTRLNAFIARWKDLCGTSIEFTICPSVVHPVRGYGVTAA